MLVPPPTRVCQKTDWIAQNPDLWGFCITKYQVLGLRAGISTHLNLMFDKFVDGWHYH